MCFSLINKHSSHVNYKNSCFYLMLSCFTCARITILLLFSQATKWTRTVVTTATKEIRNAELTFAADEINKSVALRHFKNKFQKF